MINTPEQNNGGCARSVLSCWDIGQGRALKFVDDFAIAYATAKETHQETRTRKRHTSAFAVVRDPLLG